MANSETSICNQSLGIIGAKQIGDFDNDTSVQAIQCRLHYGPTRDALLRSFRWRFAAGRSQLTEDTSTPDFEYTAQFVLPTDFAGERSVFGSRDTGSKSTTFSYSIEGELLLTNEGSVDLRYTKKITDVTKFDSLFTKLLIALLADELIGPLAGGDPRIQKKIDDKLKVLMPKARALDRQESEHIGRNEQRTWNNARRSMNGRIDSQLGS